MNSHYMLDPSDSIAQLCSENGHFLEDDYYMAMSHNEVPSSYWKRVERTPKSDRKIVIIGSHEAPMTITKSAFFALTLAKPEKITVKSSCYDESVLLKEMFMQNKAYNDCEYNVYHSKREELASNGAWLRDLEEATDVVVFGGLDTLSFFSMKSDKNKRVHLHKPKFSFGLVSKECLDNEDNLAGLAGDFLSYYGEGTLAPRFYATMGPLSDDQLIYLAECMNNEEDMIKEFRAKLPLSKRTFMLHEKVFEKFSHPHVKESQFSNPEFLTPLYGDIRLVQIDDETEFENFLKNYENVISTIALDEDTMGDTAAGWNLNIPRFCGIGSMQFPYFYEPVDEVDEFQIYEQPSEEF